MSLAMRDSKRPLVQFGGRQPIHPRNVQPPQKQGFDSRPYKGNQWLRSPDHKAGYAWEGIVMGGGGWRTPWMWRESLAQWLPDPNYPTG